MTQPITHAQSPLLVRGGRRFFLALFVLTVLALPSRGDVVILKDGYAIHGKVISELTAFFDKATGEQIVAAKMGGLSLVDDGPRFTAFSAHYKRVGDVDPQNKFAGFVQLARQVPRKTSYALPPALDLQTKGEFNNRGIRTLVYRNPLQPQNPHRIEQLMDIVTPHYVRMRSLSHIWDSYYLTSEVVNEIGVDTFRKLLRVHPDFAEVNGFAKMGFSILRVGQPDAGKRAKVIRFLIQAGLLDEADREIDRMLAILPAETKRADELREELRELRLAKAIADIERAKESGQHDFARTTIAQLPKDKLPANITLKVAGLKAEYEAGTAKLDKAIRYLRELQQATNGAKFKELIQAADMILGEIHLDGIARLDLFITLAQQAETARKEGNAPLHKPEELLAAAVCGWLLGNAATETSVVTARKRLKARDMALSYLREESSQKRRDMLLTYIGNTPDALPFDELEKLISLLPPPDAETGLSNAAMTKNVAGARYLLKLPPEYRHTRAYPLLIVLPEGGDTPVDTLKRLGDLPARYGMIVAVVDWSAGFNAAYTYTDTEQALVLDTLRHLRRTLQVDSDKVFVLGDGQGANFALDLGATHSDLFAGIIPMTPNPVALFYRRFDYWKNFQNLPVYMVVGDRSGASVKTIRDILEKWMPRGYPAIAVSYKGRGFEWFGEELPFIFDWMSRKTRAAALPDLGGSSQEFRTVRASSNHFHWISLDNIYLDSLFDPDRPDKIIYPATLQGHITEGNRITVESTRAQKLTIWLGRGSVDFTKPVYVDLKGKIQGTWRKELVPKISVLLEDLYERADRQRPFYQRIDCENLSKQVKFSSE